MGGKPELLGKLMTEETAIKKQIKDYLNAKGIFHWYNLQGLGAQKGLPDIFALKNGKLYAIEVKKKKGKLSPHQIRFLGDIRNNDGQAIVAYSYEDVAKYL